ncbi:MAG: hypothetical protein ABIG61_07840 [Planctomycetota bacterium]
MMAGVRFALAAALCIYVLTPVAAAKPAMGTPPKEPALSDVQRQDRLAEIRKWRQLRPCMSEDKVLQILGKPRLIQAAHDHAIWFYQDMPAENAEVQFNHKTDAKGKTLERTSLKSAGNIRGAVLYFEAKSLNDILNEEQEKYEEQVKQIEQRWQQDSLVPLGAEEQQKKEAVLKKITERFNKTVRQFTEGHIPRAPVYYLRFANPPDWERLETAEDGQIDVFESTDSVDKWQAQKNWKKLKINMTPQQVHAILGLPGKSSAGIPGIAESYGQTPGHGTLFFAAREPLSEKLQSWNEPFWPVVVKENLTAKAGSANVTPY